MERPRFIHGDNPIPPGPTSRFVSRYTLHSLAVRGENSGATELDEMERSHIREGRSNYDTRLCGTESLDFITEVRALGGEISGWAVVISLGRDG